MAEQITFQIIFQFLQTVGILIGVFYYIMTIRTNQRNQKMQLETRQTQLFIQYNNKFDPLQNTLDEIIDEWTWSDNNCLPAPTTPSLFSLLFLKKIHTRSPKTSIFIIFQTYAPFFEPLKLRSLQKQNRTLT